MDGLGSIAKTTNAAGVVALAREYDAWGNLQAGAEQPGLAFTGREWDPETRLYSYRARYYDTQLGRFLSEDPVPQLNETLSTYVHNRPVLLVDPTGQVALGPIALAVLGGAAIWTTACVAYVQYVYECMQNPYEAIDRSQRLKHCIAECEITRNCPGGSDTAAAAGWFREAFGDYNKGDMAAGAQGREVTKERCPLTSCLEGCEQRLKAGKI
jgi:RHS repeat-associated protein